MGIPKWVAEIVGHAGTPLDGAIHCAGVGGHIPLRAISGGNIEPVMVTNVHAALMLLRAVTAKNVAGGRRDVYSFHIFGCRARCLARISNLFGE